MDKGIRPACNAKFVELNEQRRRGLMGNTVFRKSVIAYIMEEFSTTLASAATHYNHAFKTVKGLNSELVDGLGRAEDKKGGRKSKEWHAEQAKLTAKELCGPVQPAAEQLDPMPLEQTVFQVRNKKDDAVLLEGLTFEEARTMVRGGRYEGKFRKMYWL
jgi:hypothetical protein